MMPRTRFLCAVLLSVCLAGAACAQALPRISEAKADPLRPVVGDTLRLTCRLQDPSGAVKTVTAVVRELPDVRVRLQPVEGGLLGFATPVTAELQPMVYHLDLVARDAQGFRVRLAPGSTTTATFTIGQPRVTKAPPAPDFRPPLVTVKATARDGKPIVIRHPYRSHANWYKGQLHCHTTNSDGRTPPPVLVGKYLDNGCSWLQISDHEVVTADDRAPDGRQIVRLLGRERAIREGDMVCINYREPSITLTGQDTINAVVRAGGLVMLAHPESDVGYDRQELDRLRGMALVEMMNGPDGDASREWDYLLSTGRVVWGAASDDFHGNPEGTTSRSFVVVNAPRLDPAALLENLRLGNFYASQGPVLRLELRDGALRASSDQQGWFAFRGAYGVCLHRVFRGPDRTSAVYELTGDEGYVRVEFQGPEGKMAWSQPFFVSRAK